MRIRPDVVLFSSDRGLEKGFDWAKRQALSWVSLDCPVGDYYEAALPARAAFCMRDVSHQCTGAEVLGLTGLNRNMFGKFAEAIDEKLDYCSYWEIDRWNRPCPVDYTDEQDFWYNLPANFDVLHACYRMYRWTGNREYLNAEPFDRFYQLTMENYIASWDRDGDGLMDRVPTEGRRGLVSYDESPDVCREYKVGADLLGAMARGHLSFAEISKLIGRDEFQKIYADRAQVLLRKLHTEWYDESTGQYAHGLLMDDSLLFQTGEFGQSYLLYWDLFTQTDRAGQIAKAYAKTVNGMQIEGFSHAPEILWRYGLVEEALEAFRKLTAEELPRREYPEASYCAVGAAATGLMGIEPDAAKQRIRTLSGLFDVKWAELEHVPVLGGLLSIRHDSEQASEIYWEGTTPITWRAMFHGHLKLSGQTVQTTCPFSGHEVSYVDVTVNPGERASVRVEG